MPETIENSLVHRDIKDKGGKNGGKSDKIIGVKTSVRKASAWH